MTTAVELPALDGRNALGFLAALGLIRTLDAEGISPLGLSFSRRSAAACLHSPLTSAEEIADTLQGLIARSPGAAIPGLDPRFPLPAGRNSDPMRQPREKYPGLVEEVRAVNEQAATGWLPYLLTDLAVDSQGRADLTPFCAPSGKQNLRTFFDKPLSAMRGEPSRLWEALTMWRRVDGFTGEYLDHHVINSAADDPGGRRRTRRTRRHLARHHGTASAENHWRRRADHRNTVAPGRPPPLHDLAALASAPRPPSHPSDNRTPLPDTG